METRFQFSGTGRGLFVKFLVGGILSIITCGIYVPWFLVNVTKYLCENVTLKTKEGEVRLSFSGTGGKLFVTYLVGIILTCLTIGIYGAWFLTNIVKFFYENTHGTAADGHKYRLLYNGTGGAFFVKILVGYLLTVITIGIYAPWFICNINRFFSQNTAIIEGENRVGSFDFIGTGGKLLVTYLVGIILTCLTIGIYGAWFAVKLFKFCAESSEVTISGQKYTGSFIGTGGNFFVINLVGYLLTILTLGIYGAWYCCNLIRFQVENTILSART